MTFQLLANGLNCCVKLAGMGRSLDDSHAGACPKRFCPFSGAPVTAAAGVVLDKVATAIEAKKPIITSVQETVVAAGKSAAEEAKWFAGEVADAAATAAATARAASTALVGTVLDKVATVIEARKSSSSAKKKVAKRVAAKK